MKRLSAAVQAIMADPVPRPWFSAATFLAALAAGYGGAVALRAGLYQRGLLQRRRLSCRVVSVGNLTVGGTGKTPLAMDLALRLQRLGRRVCVVSRGYRGQAEKRGAVVSDGHRILASAAVAGDEPVLMARRLAGVPVLVGRDRWASGRCAEQRFGAEVLVLDDGFQHLRLARDLNLLLLDAGAPLGNGRLLPAGPLREPPSAARRADALVCIHRWPSAGAAPAVMPAAGRPVLDVTLRPFLDRVLDANGPPSGSRPAVDLAGRRVMAFSGIAGNRRFFEAVAAMGATVVGDMGFADHHRYRAGDRVRIAAAARRTGADCLVTTAKDQARLGERRRWDLPLAVVDLGVQWHDGGAGIDALLGRCLGACPTGG